VRAARAERSIGAVAALITSIPSALITSIRSALITSIRSALIMSASCREAQFDLAKHLSRVHVSARLVGDVRLSAS
jgi:hypothetical protein